MIFHELFGAIPTLPYIYFVAFMFLLVPLINRWGSNRLGRLTFCLIPVLLTMFVTLHFKLHNYSQTDIVYFDSRFILMVTPILPGIVFRMEERRHLFLCLGISAFCVYFYDLIHQVSGVGYYQKGFTDPSYYYINYIVGVTFTVLVFGIFLMRSILETSESNVEKRNKALQEKQYEIEAQTEELLLQQEEMATSSEKLEEANALITRQQGELENYNAALERLVAEKSQELLRANEELARHNNELLQFSYTVSHNLRGPVARLMGLTQLFRVTTDAREKDKLEELVVKSSEELDVVLKDLSLIIDTRNELYRLREKVFLTEEWERAIALLGDNVRKDYRIEADFEAAPYIFGVRSMIQSILYNLLSNSIKYQSPDRSLEIRIRSFRKNASQTQLEITDNGLGIDLATQEKNVFKLYKRFHSHVAGKGLGLYLVKTQVEALGGVITIQSAAGSGTTFTVLFTEPEAVRKQIFHDTDAACVYFDGYCKVSVIQWKRPVTSAEYRQTFGVVLDSLKVYKTPGWISDVTQQGPVGEADQHWLINTLAVEALKSGLKQIALVGYEGAEKQAYYRTIVRAAKRYNVGIATFPTLRDALAWMEDTVG